ncbi:ADP-ribosyltransferase [Nocardia wallacei]|uniref:ADP-ribosyltransferase n=1 Tax=Nocardia wallacei TaxID=480035 RepID=UPI002455D081|nr:ADP-ribosyltransferase [Nocardia wallacei]
MGIEIPDSLQWVAKWVLGAGDWPEGDETAMRRVADGWSSAATTLSGLDDEAGQVIGQVLAAIDTGQTHDAISQAWQQLAGKEGALQGLVKYCEKQAELLDDGANDIEHTKLTIIATMIITAAQMAWAFTGVGAGVSAAARVAAQVSIRMAIRQLIQRMLTRAAAKAIARAALLEGAKGALEEGGVDLGARLVQVAKGDRSMDKFGLGEAIQSTVGGAVGGAVGGGLGKSGIGEVADETAGSAIGRFAGKAVTETGTELASDVAGQAAASGYGAAFLGQEFKLDLSADSLANAGVGGVHSAATDGGGAHSDSGGSPDPGGNTDTGSSGTPGPSGSQPGGTDSGSGGQPSGNTGGGPQPSGTHSTGAGDSGTGVQPAGSTGTQAANATGGESTGGTGTSGSTGSSPTGAGFDSGTANPTPGTGSDGSTGSQPSGSTGGGFDNGTGSPSGAGTSSGLDSGTGSQPSSNSGFDSGTGNQPSSNSGFDGGTGPQTSGHTSGATDGGSTSVQSPGTSGSTPGTGIDGGTGGHASGSASSAGGGGVDGGTGGPSTAGTGSGFGGGTGSQPSGGSTPGSGFDGGTGGQPTGSVGGGAGPHSGSVADSGGAGVQSPGTPSASGTTGTPPNSAPNSPSASDATANFPGAQQNPPSGTGTTPSGTGTTPSGSGPAPSSGPVSSGGSTTPPGSDPTPSSGSTTSSGSGPTPSSSTTNASPSGPAPSSGIAPSGSDPAPSSGSTASTGSSPTSGNGSSLDLPSPGTTAPSASNTGTSGLDLPPHQPAGITQNTTPGGDNPSQGATARTPETTTSSLDLPPHQPTGTAHSNTPGADSPSQGATARTPETSPGSDLPAPPRASDTGGSSLDLPPNQTSGTTGHPQGTSQGLDLPPQGTTPSRPDQPSSGSSLDLPTQDSGSTTQHSANQGSDQPPHNAARPTGTSSLDLPPHESGAPSPQNLTNPQSGQPHSPPATTAQDTDPTSTHASSTATDTPPTTTPGSPATGGLGSPTGDRPHTPTNTPSPEAPSTGTPAQPRADNAAASPRPDAGPRTETPSAPTRSNPGQPENSTPPTRSDTGQARPEPARGDAIPETGRPPRPGNATPAPLRRLPQRPGFDPAVHRYVARHDDGRLIGYDPFYSGEFNPHIGRYQPTPAEIDAARNYPPGESPDDVEVRRYLEAQRADAANPNHAQQEHPTSTRTDTHGVVPATPAATSANPAPRPQDSADPNRSDSPPRWAHHDPNHHVNAARLPDWWPRANEGRSANRADNPPTPANPAPHRAEPQPTGSARPHPAPGENLTRAPESQPPTQPVQPNSTTDPAAPSRPTPPTAAPPHRNPNSPATTPTPQNPTPPQHNPVSPATTPPRHNNPTSPAATPHNPTPTPTRHNPTPPTTTSPRHNPATPATTPPRHDNPTPPAATPHNPTSVTPAGRNPTSPAATPSPPVPPSRHNPTSPASPPHHSGPAAGGPARPVSPTVHGNPAATPPAQHHGPAPEGRTAPDGYRHFDTDSAGERYGENRLGHVYRSLPRELAQAIRMYTRQSMPNGFLRNADPAAAAGQYFNHLLNERHGVGALAALNGGRMPSSVRELANLWNHPGATNVQRAWMQHVLSNPNPGVRLNNLWSNGQQYDFLHGYFGEPPTADAFNRRVAAIDAALAHPLPEPVQAIRGVHDLSFLTAPDGRPLGSRDPRLLMGTSQLDRGYMSTALGANPPVIDGNPFEHRINLRLPPGTHGLWMGTNSEYPNQRELILPRNTEFRITDVRHVGYTGNGTPMFEIDAEVVPHSTPPGSPGQPPAPGPDTTARPGGPVQATQDANSPATAPHTSAAGSPPPATNTHGSTPSQPPTAAQPGRPETGPATRPDTHTAPRPDSTPPGTHAGSQPGSSQPPRGESPAVRGDGAPSQTETSRTDGGPGRREGSAAGPSAQPETHRPTEHPPSVSPTSQPDANRSTVPPESRPADDTQVRAQHAEAPHEAQRSAEPTRPQADQTARQESQDTPARPETTRNTTDSGTPRPEPAHYPGPTPDQREALRRYTNPDARVYEDLNRRLRDGTDLTPEQRRTADDISEGLRNLPPFEGTVWRGLTLDAEAIARYVPGATVTEAAFTSTSRDRRTSFTGDVEFVIHSSTGRDISGFSAAPRNESEVLFDRNTTFQVRGVVRDPNMGLTGGTRIYLYETPSNASPPSEQQVLHGTDRTAIGNDPQAQRVFQNLRNEGHHDVIVHGNRFGRPVPGNEHEIDPQQIVDAIRSNPNYVPGTPVRLIACHSGNDIGWAQRVADELGVPVTAPTDTVGVRQRPDSPAVVHDGGQWTTFHPTAPEGTTPEPTRHTPPPTPDGPHKTVEDQREGWDIMDNESGDSHSEPDDEVAAADAVVDTSSPEYRQTRERDFNELAERNSNLRSEGLENVRALTSNDPAEDKVRRPAERTLTTARYRMDQGQVGDLHGYSGRTHDWRPADETPVRPNRERRLFETKDAAPFDGDSPDGRAERATDRTNDSEVQMLEEIARRHLQDASGLSRKEVEAAIQKAVRRVANDVKFGNKVYPEGLRGEVMRTADRVTQTIEQLNKTAQRNAERNGTDYTPISVEDIRGDVRMVVDLPSGSNIPPRDQICDSCSDVMMAYRRAFPGIRFEVRNLAQERLR